MAERYFSITTPFKKMKLDEAWNLAADEANTFRGSIEAMATQYSQGVDQTGGVQNSSSNGHSAGAFMPGQNQAASQEMAEMWQGFLEMFDRVSEFLSNCASYGFEPFVVAYQTGFVFPLPAVSDPAWILETTTTRGFPRWQSACRQCGVDSTLVVNNTVGDEAIYVWMKTQELVEVKVSRGDYFLLRIPEGVGAL